MASASCGLSHAAREVDNAKVHRGGKLDLLAIRPIGWKYLLFASQLLTGIMAEERRYQGFESGFTVPTGVRVSSISDFTGLRIDELKRLIGLIEPMSGEISNGLASVGGASEDPDRIGEMARNSLSIYVSPMLWAEEIRGATGPGSHKIITTLFIVFRAADSIVPVTVEQVRVDR